jgi:hypothetical protein
MIKWSTPALVWLVPRPLSSSFAFSLAHSNPQNHLLYQSMSSSSWTADDSQQAVEARKELGVWPLDEHNAKLLNEVYPRGKYYPMTQTPHDVYDLIAIGAGAGGLVSSKQAAHLGAKSAMISEHLARGNCLNASCVPSKALICATKAVAQVKKASAMGIIGSGRRGLGNGSELFLVGIQSDRRQSSVGAL